MILSVKLSDQPREILLIPVDIDVCLPCPARLAIVETLLSQRKEGEAGLKLQASQSAERHRLKAHFDELSLKGSCWVLKAAKQVVIRVGKRSTATRVSRHRQSGLKCATLLRGQ